MYDPMARCSFDKIVSLIEDSESEIITSAIIENEIQAIQEPPIEGKILTI